MKVFVWALTILVLILLGQTDAVISKPLKLLVFLTYFVIIRLLMWLKKRRREEENAKQPVVTVKAKVVGRRTRTTGSGSTRRIIWYLKFKPTEGGEALEFEVSEAEASRHDEGEEALLQYRDWEYLGFRRYIFEDTPRNPPQPEVPVQKAVEAPQPDEEDDGVLTHELEE